MVYVNFKELDDVQKAYFEGKTDLQVSDLFLPEFVRIG